MNRCRGSSLALIIVRTFAAGALFVMTAGFSPTRAWAQSTDVGPGMSDDAARGRIEAAETGDQRQREILRGPFRKEVDRTRDAEEPATDGSEPQGVDEYD